MSIISSALNKVQKDRFIKNLDANKAPGGGKNMLDLSADILSKKKPPKREGSFLSKRFVLPVLIILFFFVTLSYILSIYPSLLPGKNITNDKKTERQSPSAATSAIDAINTDEPAPVVQSKEPEVLAPSPIIIQQEEPLPTLNGIMYSPSSPQAIIDGKIYSPGETVNGFKIKDITALEVVLLRDGKEHIVELD